MKAANSHPWHRFRQYRPYQTLHVVLIISLALYGHLICETFAACTGEGRGGEQGRLLFGSGTSFCVKSVGLHDESGHSDEETFQRWWCLILRDVVASAEETMASCPALRRKLGNRLPVCASTTPPSSRSKNRLRQPLHTGGGYTLSARFRDLLFTRRVSRS